MNDCETCQDQDCEDCEEWFHFLASDIVTVLNPIPLDKGLLHLEQ